MIPDEIGGTHYPSREAAAVDLFLALSRNEADADERLKAAVNDVDFHDLFERVMEKDPATLRASWDDDFIRRFEARTPADAGQFIVAFVTDPRLSTFEQDYWLEGFIGIYRAANGVPPEFSSAATPAPGLALSTPMTPYVVIAVIIALLLFTGGIGTMLKAVP